MSRTALGYLKGEKDLSQDLLQGVPLPRSAFAPPVMFAKSKSIPVDKRDFPSRKGYPSAALNQVIKPVLTTTMSQPEAFSRILIDKALEFSGWDLLKPQQV